MKNNQSLPNNKQRDVYPDIIKGIWIFGKQDVFNQVMIDIYRWLIGIIGSIFVLYIIKLSYPQMHRPFVAIISYIEKNSLGLYIISGVFNNYLMLKLTKSVEISFLTIIIETFFMLVVCLLINFIFKKIPICNKLLLGGR